MHLHPTAPPRHAPPLPVTVIHFKDDLFCRAPTPCRTVFASRADLAQAHRAGRVSLTGLPDSPDDHTSDRLKVVEADGTHLCLQDIRAALPPSTGGVLFWYRRRTQPAHLWRQAAVPGTGARGNGCYYRRPQTLRTLRELAWVEEGVPPVRQKDIVSSWDDAPRELGRCWKRFRDHQWKARG